MRTLLAILLTILSILPASIAYADTHTAASCEYSAVKNAYDAAAAGDTVSIPAGSCTWGTALAVAKANITFTGVDYTSTAITNDVNYVFTLSGETANGIRVTGIHFTNGAGKGMLYADDNSDGIAVKNFRVDHCKLTNMYYAIQTEGEATGVVDHNYIDGTYLAVIYGKATDVADNATFPMTLGGSNAVFFEDNYFINTCSSAHIIASNTGSHYVFRYNYMHSSTAAGCYDRLDAHGYGTRQTRGSYTWEIYNNVFDIDGDTRLIRPRGGQGIIKENFFRGNSDYEIALYDDQKCDYNTSCTWPCQDQINNTYIWGNKNNCGASVTSGCTTGHSTTPANDCSGTIQLGRDYTNTASPTWSAYTYPHPLVSTGGEEEDTTAPGVTFITSNPLNIGATTATATGTCADAVGITGVKYNIGSSVSANVGTACTGTTSWTCTNTGTYELGDNTLYVGCGDAAGNWGNAAITVSYTIPEVSRSVAIGGTVIGGTIIGAE